MSKTSSTVKNRYRDKNFVRIEIVVKKDLAEQFQQKVKENGDTVTGVLKKAITDYLK